jgi:hypothetical protein
LARKEQKKPFVPKINDRTEEEEGMGFVFRAVGRAEPAQKGDQSDGRTN